MHMSHLRFLCTYVRLSAFLLESIGVQRFQRNTLWNTIVGQKCSQSVAAQHFPAYSKFSQGRVFNHLHDLAKICAENFSVLTVRHE